jgi:hypothetical protein
MGGMTLYSTLWDLYNTPSLGQANDAPAYGLPLGGQMNENARGNNTNLDEPVSEMHGKGSGAAYILMAKDNRRVGVGLVDAFASLRGGGGDSCSVLHCLSCPRTRAKAEVLAHGRAARVARWLWRPPATTCRASRRSTTCARRVRGQ